MKTCKKKESTLASRKSGDISVKEMIEHRGDIHHIFPRQYFKEHGFSQSQYNQVANYVYVQQKINIKVGKRSPADYIGQIREQCQSGKLAFGGIDTLPDFEANLEANCIPGTIYQMTLEDYDEFLGVRRILMAKKIKCFYDEFLLRASTLSVFLQIQNLSPISTIGSPELINVTAFPRDFARTVLILLFEVLPQVIHII